MDDAQRLKGEQPAFEMHNNVEIDRALDRCINCQLQVPADRVGAGWTRQEVKRGDEHAPPAAREVPVRSLPRRQSATPPGARRPNIAAHNAPLRNPPVSRAWLVARWQDARPAHSRVGICVVTYWSSPDCKNHTRQSVGEDLRVCRLQT